METTYHLLNGDALKELFPQGLTGKILIFRECLVDGPVGAKKDTAFFNDRIEFLSQHYGAKGKSEYNNLFLSQMKALDQIPHSAPLYLWFEEDLFCQVNLWYSLNRLVKNHKIEKLFLVRPPHFTPYSFGGLSAGELYNCFEKATPIKKLEVWSNLWDAYQKNNLLEMERLGALLQSQYPFVMTAIKAHKDRMPYQGSLGRPMERLKAIHAGMDSPNFEEIYRAFCKTEAHYGFGDLTVKRLWKELQEKLST